MCQAVLSENKGLWGLLSLAGSKHLPYVDLICICLKLVSISLTAAELAPSVGRMTAEREVVGSIRGAGPRLVVLKSLRNDDTCFALHATRPSRGSDKWRSRFQLELLNIVSPIGTFKLNTSTLESSAFWGVPGLW